MPAKQSRSHRDPAEDSANLVLNVMAAGLDAMNFKSVDSIIASDDKDGQSALQTVLYEALADLFQHKAELSREMSDGGKRP
jgi:hypothetical protein